jgi:glycosyltransferase involved in cell wall biosynthesis
MVEVLPFAPAARELRRDRVRPTRLPLRAVALSLRYSWLISRRLRALKPTLVHTNSLKAALYGGVGGRAAGVPVLWHVRDRIADDYLPKPAVRAVRVLARWLPSTVVANSQATLDTLGPGLGSVSVTPSPVVMDAVAANESLRRIGGPFTVAIVGRLSPWKGQHIFLDAFADALPGEQHAVIVGSAMFGEDDYEHELRAQCTRLGLDDRVTFLGFQRDVFAVLAGVDAIVHASTVPEPFGQVIVEGMAAGVPVIATAAGGPLEIITDEVDGLLVAPGDVDALARALRRLEADPMLRAQLAKNGRLRALDFTPERVAAQLLDIYRRMAR